jgi:hypothetical protein
MMITDDFNALWHEVVRLEFEVRMLLSDLVGVCEMLHLRLYEVPFGERRRAAMRPYLITTVEMAEALRVELWELKRSRNKPLPATGTSNDPHIITPTEEARDVD